MKDKKGVGRPWLFRGIRLLEGIGLVGVLIGLASSRWLMAAVGAALTVASYAIYRRFFEIIPPEPGGSLGPGD